MRVAGAPPFGLSLDDRVEAAALFVEAAHVLGVAPVGGAGLGFGAAFGGAAFGGAAFGGAAEPNRIS